MPMMVELPDVPDIIGREIIIQCGHDGTSTVLDFRIIAVVGQVFVDVLFGTADDERAALAPDAARRMAAWLVKAAALAEEMGEVTR